MNCTNKGKVKFFDTTKGFGFIVDDENDQEIFFHSTNTVDKVEKDEAVAYNLEQGKRGLKAVMVQRIKVIL